MVGVAVGSELGSALGVGLADGIGVAVDRGVAVAVGVADGRPTTPWKSPSARYEGVVAGCACIVVTTSARAANPPPKETTRAGTGVRPIDVRTVRRNPQRRNGCSIRR